MSLKMHCQWHQGRKKMLLSVIVRYVIFSLRMFFKIWRRAVVCANCTLYETWMADRCQRKVQTGKRIPMLRMQDNGLTHNRNICMPRKSLSTILKTAQHPKFRGHLSFTKVLLTLSDFDWKQTTEDVKNYADGWVKCQQFKASNQRKINTKWWNSWMEMVIAFHLLCSWSSRNEKREEVWILLKTRVHTKELVLSTLHRKTFSRYMA